MTPDCIKFNLQWKKYDFYSISDLFVKAALVSLEACFNDTHYMVYIVILVNHRPYSQNNQALKTVGRLSALLTL